MKSYTCENLRRVCCALSDQDRLHLSAHKAANPDKYLVKEEVRERYPALQNIENKFGPTRVHLQVYDGMCLLAPIDAQRG